MTKEIKPLRKSAKACLCNLNLKQRASQEAQTADADGQVHVECHSLKCHPKNKYKINLVS